jgi:hypothetical protein
MTTLQAILQQASALPRDERARLAKLLFEQLEAEADSEEMAIGQRGLTALAESTREEDWTEFYPNKLRQSRE